MDNDLRKELENFHCGECFRQLCVLKKKESPTEWAKILNLAHRNMVHYRWKSQNIAANELYIICRELGVTIDEFFEIPASSTVVAQESQVKYGAKIYIEDQISDLIKRVAALENSAR